ncbi:YdcF family protein [Granulicella cerasi]|uniref:YdcF family protein n=1 Tax=Granulicella cerasi TaxID=741063 RepID=A0ABW1Z6B4_9BACT|nr:YdcF family protein [Granulicella cerasi]
MMMLKLFAALLFVLPTTIPDAAPAGVTPEVWASYRAIPTHNTEAKHFDAIIVLGVPTMPDGSASPEEISRMDEGIAEWKRGVAPVIIPTGGKAHNKFFEAHAMKLYAMSKGVPAEAIIEEGQATNTVENLWYSYKIMEEHGWKSAEVVSAPYHLPRTGLILEHYKGLQWRTHASGWPPEYDEAHIEKAFGNEANYCWKLMHEGFKPTPFLPSDATAEPIASH